MKVLVVNAGDELTLGWSYKRAFEASGCEVELIDPASLLQQNMFWKKRIIRRLAERPLIESFSRTLLKKLLETEADIIWVGKGAWATPWLWQTLKRERPATTLICYNADNPITTYSRGGNRPWVTQSIPCFDVYCTYNKTLVEPLTKAGAKRVLHVPFAWDPHIHPMQTPDDYDLDIVFVGNADAYREEWLSNILCAPELRPCRTAVFGHWPKVANPELRKKIQPQQRVGADMAEVLARSKVSLNILRAQNEGSHNMRTFETPGCGGLLVSQFSEEQNSFFPDEEAAIYFRSAGDAVKKIGHALKNTRLLSKMRQGARDRVQTQTYTKRAQQILENL